MVKKKFLHRLILVKKILANSNAEKKKFALRRDCPTPLPTPTKIKLIQKKIVEYDIKRDQKIFTGSGIRICNNFGSGIKILWPKCEISRENMYLVTLLYNKTV